MPLSQKARDFLFHAGSGSAVAGKLLTSFNITLANP